MRLTLSVALVLALSACSGNSPTPTPTPATTTTTTTVPPIATLPFNKPFPAGLSEIKTCAGTPGLPVFNGFCVSDFRVNSIWPTHITQLVQIGSTVNGMVQFYDSNPLIFTFSGTVDSTNLLTAASITTSSLGSAFKLTALHLRVNGAGLLGDWTMAVSSTSGVPGDGNGTLTALISVQ
jgi:hypothetical protein